jgi:uncharacterized protein (TIGR02246 family)
MKQLVTGCAVLASIVVPVVRPASLIAQEWSPAQQEVLAALDEYTRVSIAGDVEEIMSYFHEEFQGWDYKQDVPLGRRQIRTMIEGFYANGTITEFDVEPLAVQLRHDVAIVHLRYREAMKFGAGVDQSVAGRWTATLVKEGGKWLFLSWTWVQDGT